MNLLPESPVIEGDNAVANGTSVNGKDERAAIRDAHSLIEVFSVLRHDIPSQTISSFLLVAMEEGLSVLDYAEKAGVAQSVMTRHLLDLGERNRRKEPGLGLVIQRPDPNDLRRHQTFLTPKGRAIYHKIVRIMRAGSK